MLEKALGYHGQLSFVAFYYSPRTVAPVHCDGGDELPVDRRGWDLSYRIISHKAVLPSLEQYKTLFGKLSSAPVRHRIRGA